MNILFIGNSYTYYNDLPSLFEKLANNTYEICILQEQNILPIANYSMFLDGVKKLNMKMKGLLKNFTLYETWGRKTGSETLEEFGRTNETMTNSLSEAYQNAAKAIDADVAHVGLNFHKVYSKHPEIELYNEDKTHPSYKGSCLAALTLYKTIFGEEPIKNNTLDISAEEKRIFEEIVNR